MCKVPDNDKITTQKKKLKMKKISLYYVKKTHANH